MNNVSHNILRLLLFATIAVTLCACNETKYVADDELLLTSNAVRSLDRGVDVSSLKSYIRQSPNTKWFSTLNVPLGFYSLSGPDTTKRVNRMLRRWGEAPVILDTALVGQSKRDITQAMQNRGYLDADVAAEAIVKGKRVRMNYLIQPGEHYTVGKVSHRIADSVIDSLLTYGNVTPSSIVSGQPFSVNALHSERDRITSFLNEQGFIYFNKEAITFNVDSAYDKKTVDIHMNIGLYRHSSNEPLRQHPRYWLRNVTYSSPANDSIRLTPRTLDINTLLRPGDLYKGSNVQKTYNKFGQLQAVRSTNIRFSEVNDSDATDLFAPSRLIDAEIQLTPRKTHSLRLQPEGTNTAGDLGAAISMTYENRNVFHGAESFTLQARGAYEAIEGLEGYQRDNYMEYSFEGKLTFPEFIAPAVSRDYLRHHNAKTMLLLSYDKQNRPEFHRRVFTASWAYRWQSASRKYTYQYDFIDLNYVSMPWISETFKQDYLDSNTSRNAILRYSYEDLLIMRMGFSVAYNNGNDFVKLAVETAGNTLNAISHIFNCSKNDEGQYKFARIAFAQYAKVDAEFTRLLHFDERNTLALHARLGVGVPYGNADLLPYEKRYFSGGANSVRGWSVRELGPGRYHATDGRIDFINQTGDVRLDLNAELRSNLFWKFQGALFIDAGNIWTLKDYDDQPGGQLTLKNFYNGIAVAYGAGLRMNFGYFIMRLDLGMKAINPDYTTTREHFPITHINFSRDYALHFAVGLPF